MVVMTLLSIENVLYVWRDILVMWPFTYLYREPCDAIHRRGGGRRLQCGPIVQSPHCERMSWMHLLP